MKYRVTLAVSEFGFLAGIAFIAICTLAGFLSKDVAAGLAAFFISGALAIPFLMFCEGMHALVTIANNTK